MTNTLRAVLLALPMSMLMIQSPLRADDESSDDMYENDSLEHVQVTATRTSKRDIDISGAVTAIDEKAIRELAPDVIAEMLRGQPFDRGIGPGSIFLIDDECRISSRSIYATARYLIRPK